MHDTDMTILGIKDQIGFLLGQIDDCSGEPASKENKEQLLQIAKNLHKAADDIVWLVARMKK
ncbi:MAG: hypothetical protein ILO36_07175 [Abditibacteriota bacterium]|nr:hypothetical protein [Abditibacteriota bacterium]